MKKITIWALLVGLCLLVVSTASAAPAAKPFVGQWEAIDVDGSYMKLTIAGQPAHYNLRYIDFGASVCGLDDDGVPLYAFHANGDGVSTGNHLDADFPAAYCMKSPKELWGSYSSWFDYDSASDTLWDGWVTWKRMSAQ